MSKHTPREQIINNELKLLSTLISNIKTYSMKTNYKQQTEPMKQGNRLQKAAKILSSRKFCMFTRNYTASCGHGSWSFLPKTVSAQSVSAQFSLGRNGLNTCLRLRCFELQFALLALGLWTLVGQVRAQRHSRICLLHCFFLAEIDNELGRNGSWAETTCTRAIQYSNMVFLERRFCFQQFWGYHSFQLLTTIKNS